MKKVTYSAVVCTLNSEKNITLKCLDLQKGCYSLDFANRSNKVVFYGGADKCYIISI